MQNPIRDQIRLDGPGRARQLDAQTATVFVPGSWTEKQVVLLTGGQGEAALAPLAPGEWNTVQAPSGVEGARLEASHPLHITRLEANGVGKAKVAVRIALGGDQTAAGLLLLHFTLTASDGRQVGDMQVVVGNKTRDLSLEMPLETACAGVCRLKATLCGDDQVIDNARADLEL